MHSLAHLRALRFSPASAVVHVGGALAVEMTVCSRMPVPVPLEQLAVSVHFSIEKGSCRKPAEWLTKHGAASGTVSFPPEPSALPASQSSLPALELHEVLERSPSDHSLSSAGIICKNVHMLLRRQEGAAALEAAAGLALEDGAHVLRCSGVTLQPGANTVTFRTQVRRRRRWPRGVRAGSSPSSGPASIWAQPEETGLVTDVLYLAILGQWISSE